MTDGSTAGGGPAPATDAGACVRMFAEFARVSASRAPLYARLATGIAADPELAGLLLVAPPSQRQPVLLLACVHDLLLADATDELATFYPNLTPEPAGGDPVPALRRFVVARQAELTELLSTRVTQTNEIGRCALLLPVFGLLAAEMGPLAHVDVGTSAGLNLLIDRFRYVYEPGGVVGAPGPVVLECSTRGAVPVPATMPTIAARVGIDRRPVDVHDPDQARWLEACVWPDQRDRFERLRAALDMARAAALDVRHGDAVAATADTAAAVAAAGHPVITNTWVLNYLSRQERVTYLARLDELGARRDVSWVFAESPRLVAGLPVPDGGTDDRTVVTLVRWRGGERRVDHLAEAHPHGYWLHWR